jgi:hypothetical protein
MRGKLSFVETTLKYTDYVLMRAILRDNIGRKVDKEKWDNVEKAYWMEEAALEEATIHSLEGTMVKPAARAEVDVQVAYASNARFVRYGKKGKKGTKGQSRSEVSEKRSPQTESPSAPLDLRFELDGLSLKLRRDDQVEGTSEMSSAFCYDVMLLRVQVVEISVNTNPSGDMSFHLSLFRLNLFDLGDSGRLLRERYVDCLPGNTKRYAQRKRKGIRLPCPFSVLAEGYSPSKEKESLNKSQDGSADVDPQLVVTVDRCPASSAGAIGTLADDCELPEDSKVTVARIVINYLSVNALLRPFREIISFLSCDWKTNNVQPRLLETTEAEIADIAADAIKSKTPASGGFQLKMVAHYPRIFFLADESDPHSRALVLRG